MSNRPSPEIERTSVVLSGISSTGWQSVSLPVLGRAGKVLSIKLREDASLAKVSAAAVYLTDGSGSAPADEDVFYASGSLAVAGSATEASLKDVIPGGAPYRVSRLGDLCACVDVTAVGGAGASGTLHLDIIAEVWA